MVDAMEDAPVHAHNARILSKEVWHRIIASSVNQLRMRFEERSRILGISMLPVVPNLTINSQTHSITGNSLYQNEWGWLILHSLVRCSNAAMAEAGVGLGGMPFVLDVLLPTLRQAANQEDPDGFARLEVDNTATFAAERQQRATTGKRRRTVSPASGSAPCAFPTAAAPAVAPAVPPAAVARALPSASSAEAPATAATALLPAKAARASSPAESAACRSAQLRDAGWCVLPLFPASDVPAIRQAFWKAVASFPEYQPHVRGKDLPAALEQHLVQGGFGALGNPASFHNPFVREWRARALVAVLEHRVFSAEIDAHAAGSSHVRLEQVIDRMMIRRPSKRASAESWHRDEAISCLEDDVVYGGWINFDPHPQVLSAVPNSHAGVTGHGGFAKLSAADAADAAAHRQKLSVPAGHMLIFNEKLVHEVCPAKPATPSHTILRLFTGWRLTTAVSPQLGAAELEGALDQQAVCRLKSGQTPKMYANMSWSQPGQRKALEAWSVATFEPLCRTRRAVQTKRPPKSAAAGAAAAGAAAAGAAAAGAVDANAAVTTPAAEPQEVRDMVQQQMCSLQAYGFPLYPSYTESERSMHYPNRTWKLTLPGEGELREHTLTQDRSYN